MDETQQPVAEQSADSPNPSPGDGRCEWQTPVLIVDDVSKVTEGGTTFHGFPKPDGYFYS